MYSIAIMKGGICDNWRLRILAARHVYAGSSVWLCRRGGSCQFRAEYINTSLLSIEMVAFCIESLSVLIMVNRILCLKSRNHATPQFYVVRTMGSQRLTQLCFKDKFKLNQEMWVTMQLRPNILVPPGSRVTRLSHQSRRLCGVGIDNR